MKNILQLAATALLALSTSQASAAISIQSNIASVQQQYVDDPQFDFMNELESTYFLLLDIGVSPSEADDIILDTLEIAIFGKVGSANVGLTQPHYYNLQQTDMPWWEPICAILCNFTHHANIDKFAAGIDDAVLGQANGLTGDSFVEPTGHNQHGREFE
jgi:hypothetical protein